MKELPDNSIDAIVTDPPYGLSNIDEKVFTNALLKWVAGKRDFTPAGRGFMGKTWDAFVPPPAVWDECFRILKPGGHILVFAGSRTIDLMGVSVRMAGFEIRDSLAWIYGQGFPKSLDISKAIDKAAGAEREVIGSRPLTGNGKTMKSGFHQPDGTGAGETVKQEVFEYTAPATDEAKKWEGWGTALKPAMEPIIMARKPLSEKTVATNVLKWGTGGINIADSRVGFDTISVHNAPKGTFAGGEPDRGSDTDSYREHVGRYPSNVIFGHTDSCVQTSETNVWECVDGCPVKELDRQSGIRPGGMYPAKRGQAVNTSFASGQETVGGQRSMGDSGGASRYFYQAKANKKDRNEGLDGLPEKGKVFNGKSEDSAGNAPGSVEDKFTTKPQTNFHPTVKPTDLLRYLVRMVCPPDGVVLDPFIGSGSTGKAAILEGFKIIGVETTSEYLPIIQGRIEHATKTYEENNK
jgi:site-specific DNA-methyltransferase (adenine-specific)